MEDNNSIPVQLKIIAFLLILDGIVALIDILTAYENGQIYFNIGIVSLFVGPGLLGLRRGWRILALVYIWFHLIGNPLRLLLLLGIGSYMPYTPFVIEQTSIGIGILIIAVEFFIALWAYKTLTRSEVHVLFDNLYESNDVSFFLRFNHWQMFLIIVATFIPVFYTPQSFYYLMEISTVTSIITFFYSKLWFLFLIIWLYNLGTNLWFELLEEINIKITFFKFNVVFLIVFIIYFMTLLYGLFPDKLFISIPFFLYALFALFYSMHFVSKTLASVEKEEKVGFNRWVGPFFMFLIYPIGIWWLQPRIKKIFD